MSAWPLCRPRLIAKPRGATMESLVRPVAAYDCVRGGASSLNLSDNTSGIANSRWATSLINRQLETVDQPQKRVIEFGQTAGPARCAGRDGDAESGDGGDAAQVLAVCGR